MLMTKMWFVGAEYDCRCRVCGFGGTLNVVEEIWTEDSVCCDREMAKNEDNENCEFKGMEGFGSWYGG